jgi:hypothetical protein
MSYFDNRYKQNLDELHETAMERNKLREEVAKLRDRIRTLEATPARVDDVIQFSQDDETITVSVMPVTEAEAIAALTRKGWKMQTSPLGSFRFLLEPDDDALTGGPPDAA